MLICLPVDKTSCLFLIYFICLESSLSIHLQNTIYTILRGGAMIHQIREKRWAILKPVLSLLLALSLFTLPGCGLSKEDKTLINQGIKAAEESKAAASRAEAATKRLEDVASRLESAARKAEEAAAAAAAAADRADAATNRASEAASRAETTAKKTERIFEKTLLK